MHRQHSPSQSSVNEHSEYLDFDGILQVTGNFGRYQLLLLILFGFINVIVSMHYFSQTMISFEPKHWCYHEKLKNMSYREIEKIYSQTKNPSCTKLVDIKENGEILTSEEPCQHWIYELDYNYESMVADLDWVCQNKYKSSVGQSLFFIGSVVGTLSYGVLSDRIGRLPSLILSHLCAFVGDFSTIFAHELWSFSTCRFISGLAVDTNFFLMYIIVLEYIRPKLRTLGLNLMIGVFYCLGLVMSPWLAVFLGYWKYFLCTTSTPILLVISFYFLVHESAQWLVTRDNVDGAINKLQKVATMNGREVTEANFQKFRVYCKAQQEKENLRKNANLFDLFKTPRLRRHTLILFFKSIVITLGYDVVSRNVEGMGISPFILFTVSSLTVLPSGLTLILLQDHIGRKGMATGAMIFACIITTTTGIVLAYFQNDTPWQLILCLIVAARYAVAIISEAGSQYATEIIPTCVRGQGVAAVHVAGFAILFLMPYILYMGTYFKPGPSLILGMLFFLGAFACLLLPETLNRVLANTIEEAEEFGKGEAICNFPCCSK